MLPALQTNKKKKKFDLERIIIIMIIIMIITTPNFFYVWQILLLLLVYRCDDFRFRICVISTCVTHYPFRIDTFSIVFPTYPPGKRHARLIIIIRDEKKTRVITRTTTKAISKCKISFKSVAFMPDHVFFLKIK